jgi:hypothetical protein
MIKKNNRTTLTDSGQKNEYGSGSVPGHSILKDRYINSVVSMLNNKAITTELRTYCMNNTSAMILPSDDSYFLIQLGHALIGQDRLNISR